MLSKTDFEERIAIRIAKATEAMQSCMELTPQFAKASETLANSLLNDGKLLVLGTGASAALAQIFVAHLMHRFDRERPGLPAIALSADVVTMSALMDDPQSDQYARQIRALAKAGDAMMVISATGHRANVTQAVIAARECHLPVVALTGAEGGDIAPLLQHTDTELRVRSSHATTVREQHLMIIHCLNELIDAHIFG
ncbi:MAG: SIS domain-containing protein [Litorivicinaceae bacterium]|nr:SIS domain-containing protein [Litorivicinaceae bacterium]MDP5328540.1 SIS domain-containing protein [Litorivicinaceae bacterium]MDP5330487.1 SIS domain-containing protein [Litorivicinaceae bacterium]MDP5341000.1 SIS domain-containing protein [Litorivicinaceae bacterium]MDP5342033.1 SIS domain-containing protein [Litorivicinaceae bacterium]